MSLRRGWYWVTVCSVCSHPGGAHLTGGPDTQLGCRYCEECPGWVEGGRVKWNDAETRALTGGHLLSETPLPPWIQARRTTANCEDRP